MLALSLAQVQVPGGGKEAEGLVSASRSPGLTKEGKQREALAQSPSGQNGQWGLHKLPGRRMEGVKAHGEMGGGESTPLSPGLNEWC